MKCTRASQTHITWSMWTVLPVKDNPALLTATAFPNVRGGSTVFSAKGGADPGMLPFALMCW
ncbi:hypothetical protein BT69DRAFT_1281610 [Atractiella rhizophila]|nr:hypothetical protein BT69DRAFT_1281610 [Atractiella rhizophila]